MIETIQYIIYCIWLKLRTLTIKKLPCEIVICPNQTVNEHQPNYCFYILPAIAGLVLIFELSQVTEDF